MVTARTGRERIFRVEQVLAHAGDPGPAGDLRDHGGRPGDVGLLDEPAGEARADHGLVDERPRPARARRGRAAGPCARSCRCRTASGRASRGGSTSRRPRPRRRGRARGRRRGGSRRCAGPRGARGARSALIAAITREAGVDQLAGARRVDDEAGVGGRRERVEVAAVGHVVRDLAEPGDVDGAVAGVQERRDVADRDRARAAVLDRARAPRPARPGRRAGSRSRAR